MVNNGTSVSLTVPDRPGETFTAKVSGLASAVNAESGTTLVQLLVDNSARKLLPGAFANVHFTLPLKAEALRVPASALVVDNSGLRVATLDAGNHVDFKSITIEEDFGSTVEIRSGLDPRDRIVDTPPDGLAQGDLVQVADTRSNAPKASAK